MQFRYNINNGRYTEEPDLLLDQFPWNNKPYIKFTDASDVEQKEVTNYYEQSNEIPF